jgi:hypothetical protein
MKKLLWLGAQAARNSVSLDHVRIQGRACLVPSVSTTSNAHRVLSHTLERAIFAVSWVRPCRLRVDHTSSAAYGARVVTLLAASVMSLVTWVSWRRVTPTIEGLSFHSRALKISNQPLKQHFHNNASSPHAPQRCRLCRPHRPQPVSGALARPYAAQLLQRKLM